MHNKRHIQEEGLMANFQSEIILGFLCIVLVVFAPVMKERIKEVLIQHQGAGEQSERKPVVMVMPEGQLLLDGRETKYASIISYLEHNYIDTVRMKVKCNTDYSVVNKQWGMFWADGIKIEFDSGGEHDCK